MRGMSIASSRAEYRRGRSYYLSQHPPDKPAGVTFAYNGHKKNAKRRTKAILLPLL
jgi:hypothetical protein